MVFTGHKVVGRPESARCGRAPRCWMRCHRSSGRRDDRDRRDGAVDLRPGPAQVRGRHASHRGGGGPRGALGYLSHLGMAQVQRHEQAITAYALEGLATVPGLTVLGLLEAEARGGAIAFELDGVHPRCRDGSGHPRHRRAGFGHHCAKPAHARFGVQSSTRMSSYLYTTPAEIDALVDGLHYTRSYSGVA
ncbi:MAG: aminotransferase class V-fold PLP-dependent enzyme [Nocardioides sp.]